MSCPYRFSWRPWLASSPGVLAVQHLFGRPPLRHLTPRLRHPVQPLNVVRSQQQVQLRRVFLHMSHTVQLQLKVGRFHPFEYADTIRPLVRQPLCHCLALFAALHEKTAHIRLLVWFVRQLASHKRRGQREAIPSTVQEQGSPRQRMIRNPPVLPETRVLRVFSHRRRPQRLRAQPNCVVQRIQRRTELLPQAVFHIRIHYNTSSL